VDWVTERGGPGANGANKTADVMPPACGVYWTELAGPEELPHRHIEAVAMGALPCPPLAA
jgi:hypothetical protein